VIRDFLTSFQEQISLWQGGQTLGISAGEIKAASIDDLGAIESVSKMNDISSVSYYAIGMSMMFVFYVATTAASFAYTQKEEHLYNRILLANVPTSIFFSGIFSAAAIVCFLQLNILFGLSVLIFDVSYPDIVDYLIITCLISIMIGSFASLLSAVSYRSSSEKAARVFGNFLVPVFAFVGGSFFPVSQLGGIFENLGSYSPGGAGISAYLKILQGYPLGEAAGQLWSLALFSAILVIAALLVQPRKGESA
jgi:ABC-2 type transport system permease protein